ncbi:MAG: hypothetical protein U0T82_07845 [Bacteroidales bacterium]
MKWPVLVLTVSLFSCDLADNRFNVINNSDKTIQVYWSTDSSMNDVELFRNGYYKNSVGDSSYFTSDHFVNSYSQKHFPMWGVRAWIHYVKSSENKTLFVSVISDSILQKYSDNEIYSNGLFLLRTKYSLSELEELNWTIKLSNEDFK